MATDTRTRPRMSEAEAKSFSRQSVSNAMLVAGHFRCGCNPYADVYTFNRWRAQGYGVCKGEHGLRLPLVREVDEQDEDGFTGRTARILGASWVFCRHQVKPYGSKGAPAPAPTPALTRTTTPEQIKVPAHDGYPEHTITLTERPFTSKPTASFAGEVMATWKDL